MFAYVYYLEDGIKDSVSIKDIKHFDPKTTSDFSSTRTYWILRKGRFSTGQILFMKETCEEIEQFLATGKRIRVPKLLDKVPPENKSTEKKEARDNAAAQKASIGEGKQTFLMDILKKRQALKRQTPLCLPHPTKKRVVLEDEMTTDSDDELIPKSKFNDLEKRYKILSRKYQDTVAEVKEIRKLNIELQTCLVAKILHGTNTSATSIQTLPITTGSNASPASIPDLPTTTGCNTSPASIADPSVTTGNNASPASIAGFNTSLASTADPSLTTDSSPRLDKTKTPQTTAENSSAVGTVNCEQISEDNEVDIGEGVVIHREKLKKIQANLKDSLFVKELAVCIWGTSTLANRSLEGKTCPTTKSEPRPPLTPHKFRALKGCFHKWLESKNLEEAELKARAGKLGRYVTEKIQDINKKIKSNK